MCDLNFWIDIMMKNLKIDDYNLNVGGNTTKGDGYLGEVTFLTVTTKKNGIKKDYDLVIKSAKKSEELRKQTPIKEAYDRETLFYRKIFPILDAFQKERGVERPFKNVPKCYSAFDGDMKEAVILENLKSVGFDLHDRKNPMNLNHVHLIFTQYGRFHALSLALKIKKPAVFSNLTKNLGDIFGKFIVQGQMMNVFHREFDNVIKLLEQDGHLNAVKKFHGLNEEFDKILINFTNEHTSPSVLLHGDCWNNNFMFKYDGEDKSKPIDMCFLDFQLSRIGSPILDLSYFLYSCADGKVLKNFDFILQAYHQSLSDSLFDLGCDIDSIFPLNKLQEQWKKFGKYGLVIALFLLKISLCDSSEAPDLMESAEKGEDFNNSLNIKLKNEDGYNRRIKDVYLHFADKFL